MIGLPNTFGSHCNYQGTHNYIYMDTLILLNKFIHNSTRPLYNTYFVYIICTWFCVHHM